MRKVCRVCGCRSAGDTVRIHVYCRKDMAVNAISFLQYTKKNRQAEWLRLFLHSTFIGRSQSSAVSADHAGDHPRGAQAEQDIVHRTEYIQRAFDAL